MTFTSMISGGQYQWADLAEVRLKCKAAKEKLCVYVCVGVCAYTHK